MKVQGSEVFSQTSTFDYLFEWVKSLYDHDIRNRGNDVSSFCDLWLSPSAGVKLPETWHKLLWLQQVFRKESEDTNLLFINSQLCIDLLCTPSALALLYIILYSAHGSQAIKVNENLSLFCWFLMVSCHASNMPNWIPPQDFHAGSFLCLECFPPGLCKAGFLIGLSLTSINPPDCPPQVLPQSVLHWSLSESSSLFISLHSPSASRNDMHLFFLPLLPLQECKFGEGRTFSWILV